MSERWAITWSSAGPPCGSLRNTYGGIGVFGLVLAAIGLAGVTAYAVARRRKEIGIRMALGASKAQVLRLVLREGTALVSVGTVLGFLGAIALAKVLSALASIFVEALQVGTDDPRLLVGAPLLLAALRCSPVTFRRAGRRRSIRCRLSARSEVENAPRFLSADAPVAPTVLVRCPVNLQID